MTDDDLGPLTELADQPLDADDIALLGEVAVLLDDVDPMPEDLVERIRFAAALDEVFAEVASVVRMPEDALAVRGETATEQRAETLTFSSQMLTAMVTLSHVAPGRLRVDGWVTPGGVRRVVVRMQSARVEVETDVSGRFVIEDLREGFAQLVFHSRPGEAHEADQGPVVTPLLKL